MSTRRKLNDPPLQLVPVDASPPASSDCQRERLGIRYSETAAFEWSMTLSEEVIVVTGASAGVGRAVARAFGARGRKVALLARGTEGLKAARREVEAAGGQGLDLQVDVSERDSIEAATEAIEAELGPIDVWVNNAMVGVFDEFLDVDPEDFERVTSVIYLGYVNGTRSALKRMVPRDRGTVVQVGSALAFRAIPLQSAYCGAKHAIEGFTESVRCELLHRKSGVCITEVHLPALNTPQFHWVKTSLKRHPQPVPPIYQPEVAARAIVWASQHPRRQLFVGASTLLTVWANRLAPGLIDRYLARMGYESQQAPWEIEDGRRDNLYEPVPEDHGARGEFDQRAHSRSLQLLATTNRSLVGVGGAVTGGAIVAMTRRRRAASRRRRPRSRP
jgi:NAD(P)-dependent dehydrogenase (short-subunit alcohol dehydrogenase family)